MNILIVDDNQVYLNSIKRMVTEICEKNGIEVAVRVTNIPESVLKEQMYLHNDIILLDIMLPEINGHELMEYIKPMGIPVIFITAMAELDDRVKGLTSGAEDYIVKPFEIVELLARINIVLRRYNKTDTILSFKDLKIDVENRIVTREGIKLTPKEFDLLVLFVRNVNMTLFKDKIFETIWETEWQPESRTVDLHVQRLRKKLNLKDNLKTAYSTGYRLSDK